MKAKLTPLRPFAIESAAKAREALAQRLFNRDEIAQAISSAAIKGELAVKVPQDVAVNLNNTEEAARLGEWVTRLGMSLEWVERVMERPNGLRVKVFEPVISWGDELISRV